MNFRFNLILKFNLTSSWTPANTYNLRRNYADRVWHTIRTARGHITLFTMQLDSLISLKLGSNGLAVAFLVLFVLCAFAWLSICSTRGYDTREPPSIRPTIPFIGHLLVRCFGYYVNENPTNSTLQRSGHGLVWSQILRIRQVSNFNDNQTLTLANTNTLCSSKTNYPIFTLPILGSRNYIVTDATLAGIIQRNNKTLSFYSLIVEVTRRLIAFDENASRITFDNINGERGPGGMMEVVHEMLNRHLAPGIALDAMTAVQMQKTAEMLAVEVPRTSKGIDVNLYAWLRHIFSLCNAQALYGSQNIFAVHPELENEFWKFEDGMLGLVIDILPQFTTRKAFYARKRVLEALHQYVKTEQYKKASPLIQERVQTNLTFGLGEKMAGHAELILMFGILGNAVPSSFWLVANIFSRPQLLQRVREEVRAALEINELSQNAGHAAPVNGKRTFSISSKAIVKRCPLLYGCYRETLRDISLLTSARLVMEDTIVADKYLLRKNSVVQIAGGVIHHSPEVWGNDAVDFNPDRFLSTPASTPDDSSSEMSSEKRKNTARIEPDGPKPQASPLPKGVPSAAFRAFGGGTVICPGRHFAQSELMTLAAVLAIGFDITNADGSSLTLPEKDEERIPLAVVKPKIDPAVRICRRSGWEDVDWIIDV